MMAALVFLGLLALIMVNIPIGVAIGVVALLGMLADGGTISQHTKVAPS